MKIFLTILALMYFFMLVGCENTIDSRVDEPVEINGQAGEPSAPTSEFLSKYNRISWKARFELLKAMIATVKYHRIENAFDDGYADINVVMPNMGYHYLKNSFNDEKFEITKPEILVYSKDLDSDKMKLVAVEYSVPINLSPDKAPEGFTGDADVWKYDTNFGLWLLHAWIWKYNPEGVFNPTNPRVP